MRGLRDFIPNQDKVIIAQAISMLREEVDFDVLALNHIQLALYLFQDAVSLPFTLPIFIQIGVVELNDQFIWSISFYMAPIDVDRFNYLELIHGLVCYIGWFDLP